MVPKGWNRTTIGQVAQVTSGGTPSRTVPAYWGGCIPWVTTGLIKFNTIVDAAEHITEEGLMNSSAKLFPAKTLLVALYGDGVTRGKVAMLGIEAATNQACAAILPGKGVHPEYLFCYISAHYEALRQESSDGNQKNLSGTLVKSFPILVPPMIEQQKIAAILSTWDRAIELTEKLIAAKQKRKQALMQQLLTGKVRLPGFEKSTWKKCLLGDVAANSTLRNGVPTTQPVVYSVTNSVGMVPMDEGVIGESIDRYKAVSRFDFAYNPMRINVGSIAMWEGDEDVLVSPDYVVFRCGPKLDAVYLNHFRRTYFWRLFVNRSGGGSVRVRIYFSDLASMKLKLPPVEEQKAIAAVLNVQDNEIRLLGRRLDAVKLQKKGLMQQLLTGKIRVNVEAEKVKG